MPAGPRIPVLCPTLLTMTADRRTAAAVPALPHRLARHRSQARRLLDDGQQAMRRGRWNQAEELLWGSLTAAVRGVALWHGEPADSDAARRDFLHRLGEQEQDRYIRDAYDHLAAFAETAERVRDRTIRVDYLYIAVDNLTETIERLIARIPGGDAPVPVADPDAEIADFAP